MSSLIWARIRPPAATASREKSSAAPAEHGKGEPAGVVRRYAERAMPVSMPLFELGFKGSPAPKGEGPPAPVEEILRKAKEAGVPVDIQ